MYESFPLGDDVMPGDRPVARDADGAVRGRLSWRLAGDAAVAKALL